MKKTSLIFQLRFIRRISFTFSISVSNLMFFFCHSSIELPLNFNQCVIFFLSRNSFFSRVLCSRNKRYVIAFMYHHALSREKLCKCQCIDFFFHFISDILGINYFKSNNHNKRKYKNIYCKYFIQKVLL